jgi:pyruvate carboxylase subunit B
MKLHVTHAGRERVVQIRTGPTGLEVLVDGEPHPADLEEIPGTGLYSLLLEGQSLAFAARFEDGEAVLSFHDREVAVGIEDERTRLAREATGGRRGGGHAAALKSVMPGVVREIRIVAGDTVQAGQPLLILEAMKMENEIRAPAEGVVEKVHVEPGTAVEKGALLVTLAPPSPAG